MRKLTYNQLRTIVKINEAWGPLPASMGCTNMTLVSLEKLGRIEMRIKLGYAGTTNSGWECRLTPKGNDS